ncbi:helix-turn-helix domain-containing protein [Hoeflea prorocentri]|uniref:Helix-turn-helix domain-containing protein n=1 Tax=Hoeflea prorocentri TaxID=1922333 RepID=A0A9X3UJZ8_9HYPH|nr:helix-turn-helix domain-containing protein [Hoeflea prorocentri]MCY6380539.1 helix-turn-helix domain-containing protein [Hoeflea prorocentri]MDA5398339.1 helix-turn-helix domain-containing protein [Hoeflea prorocentri]
MAHLSSRLKAAREAAGYRTATIAAEALGVSYSTYASHENGSRGVSRPALTQYAKRFKVTTDWLLSGRGGGPDDDDVLPQTNTTLVSSKNPDMELDLDLFDQATQAADMIIEDYGRQVSLEKRHKLIQQQYHRLRALKSKNLVKDKG